MKSYYNANYLLTIKGLCFWNTILLGFRKWETEYWAQFYHILRADPKCMKMTAKLSISFTLLGSTSIKASLVKLSTWLPRSPLRFRLDVMFSHYFVWNFDSCIFFLVYLKYSICIYKTISSFPLGDNPINEFLDG